MLGSASLPTSISAALATRADEIARHWLERLHARLADRAMGVPPSPSVLERVPSLVRWAARSGPSEGLPRDVEDALRSVVLDRVRQDHLLEEVMLELGVLETILFEVAAEEVEDRRGTAAEGLALGGMLARKVTAAMTYAAGVFNEEVEEERRSDRRKLDSFTRTVSHEMRTPIGAAFTAARMLEEVGDELPAEERARLLGVVSRGLDRATHLLESVMSLSRVRAPAEAKPRSLRAVVEDAVAATAEGAGAAGVRVEIGGAVPAVEVDAGRVELLLGNLLSNAVRYADPDKKDRWVRVRVQRDRERLGWRVQVADNGLGIPREHQRKVFRRFYRAHADLARGTGLGLVVAREAAEQLGSDLLLESVPGVGTALFFTVPDPVPS